MSFETWGTFSVADHLGPRAFVADVLLYDRLVIPVPDDNERERWVGLGRHPEILDRKLEILGYSRDPEENLVAPVRWTEEYRQHLDREYPEERARAREATGEEAIAQAHEVDRGIIAALMSAGNPITPEFVPAYTSYPAIEADFRPAAVSHDRVARPEDRLVGVIGWEFFVPADRALDDDGLLEEAVKLAHDKNFRQTRAAFHSFRREAIQQCATPKQFRGELERLLGRYQEQTSRLKRRTTTLNGFVFVGAAASLVGMLFVPPVGLAAPAMTLARVAVEKRWRSPDDPDTRAVAMFHDARKHFDSHE